MLVDDSGDRVRTYSIIIIHNFLIAHDHALANYDIISTMQLE